MAVPTTTDQALDSARALLGRIGDKPVRQRMNKILVLWDLGYLREALAQFRLAAEHALRRVLARRAPPEQLPTLEGALEQGQSAKVIERLYRDHAAIPARVALHLHTLLAWGNYASHHQKQGHHARPSDLAVLIAVAVDLEDWLSSECEGAGSVFGTEDLAWVMHKAEEQTIESGLIPPEVARAFVTPAGHGVEVEPHRLVAPHLSLELYWRLPALPQTSQLPYRGLMAFDPEDAGSFFGRDAIGRQLEHSVDTRRLTLVSGASGAGKTSLLRAGLIPVLIELGCGVVMLSEYSRRGLDTVKGVLRRWPERPLVLILDQLERALLAEVGHELRRDLISLVLETGRMQQGRRVVIGIREDFLGRLLREARSYDATRALIDGEILASAPLGDGGDRDQDLPDGGALVVVGPLDREETREAMVRPLEGTGLRFDEDLVQQVLLPELLESAGTSPSKLQIVCGRLYTEARSTGATTIDGRLYQRLGGADRIIGTYLDEALCSETYRGEQQLARALLKTMTGIDTRRWVDLGNLWLGIASGRLRTDEVQLQSVLAKLIDDRLVVSRSSGPAAQVEYSLMHDQLAATVRGWTSATELEIQEAQERLDRALATWDDPDRREVLRGRSLRLVEAHFTSLRTPDRARDAAQDLLSASRRGRMARRLSVGLLLSVAALGLVFGVYQLRRSVRQRDRAVQLADQGVYLRALLELDRDPTLAIAWLRNLSLGTGGAGVLTLIEEAKRRGVARVLHGHEHLVTAAVFSPDGTLIASASRDRTVRLWDPKTLRQLSPPIRGHTDIVSCIAFSPDGRLLASSSLDQTIRLWRVPTGRRVATLRGHTSWVHWVSFSPDGKMLASVDARGQLLRWELSTRQPVGPPVPGHDRDAMFVAFSPDGKTMATGSLDRTVRLWDAHTGHPREPPLQGHRMGVYSVAFSPDGRTLASASRDSTVRLWDVASGTIRGEPLTGHTSGVLAVAFSPDGRTLASSGADKVARLWQVSTGRAWGEPLRGHLGLVRHLSFSPDGRILASSSRDHTVRLWDLASRRAGGLRLRGHQQAVQAVTFSPDGKTLASASRDESVTLWEMGSLSPRGTPLRPGGPVFAVAYSPDGQILATGSGDGRVLAWRPGQPDQPPRLLGQQEKGIQSVAFSPDGRFLAAGSVDGRVQLVQMAPSSGRGRTLVGHEDAVFDLTFTPGGKRLISAGRDRTIRLWDLESGRNEGKILGAQQDDAVYTVAVSPDGRTLASGGGDATIRFWDLDSLRPVGAPLLGHHHWVLSVVFSSDGQTLASGSSDGTVRLWDVGRRRPAGPPLKGHTDWVHSVAFSPDGQVLASASADRTVWLWQLSETKLPRLRRIIDRLTNMHVSVDGQVTVR